jgi:hypothetical protein
MEVSGQIHAPAALSLVPLLWEAEWAPITGVDARNKKNEKQDPQSKTKKKGWY